MAYHMFLAGVLPSKYGLLGIIDPDAHVEETKKKHGPVA
jgi:hypothetical protein